MTQYDTFTNKGTREINEDRCGVAMHEDSYCFTVADGLGGHGNGEIAAQAAVDEVLQGKYPYVLTTHIDKGHVHNHIIFCAVDMVNQRKYISNKQSYAYILSLIHI